jgi:hypothetical protein
MHHSPRRAEPRAVWRSLAFLTSAAVLTTGALWLTLALFLSLRDYITSLPL